MEVDVPGDLIPLQPATLLGLQDGSSSKTSSSEDILPGKLPRRSFHEDKKKASKKSATVSAVTLEARRVLEQFLKQSLSHSEASFHDDEESPYAMLVQQPGEPFTLKSCKPDPDDEAKNDFTDYEKIDDSPDYAECYDITDGMQATCSISSQSSFGVSLRGHEGGRCRSPCERALHAVHPVDRISHSTSRTPKVKSKSKVRRHRDYDLHHSDSSSSTEDYEYPDVELLARKKKSFFKWASERLRQSFRREDKKTLSTMRIRSAEILDSPRDCELLPPPPLPRTPKSHKKDRRFKLALRRSGSDKSKSTSISPPTQDRQDALSDCGDLASRFSEIDPLPTESTAVTSSKKTKSPLPWRRNDAASGQKDNRSLFDSFLHHIRKGSQKLKRKGPKERQRSRSADNLAIRPLSKEHEKLLQRYVRATGGDQQQSKGADSDYEQHTVRSVHEVSVHRVTDGRLFAPPSPLLAAESDLAGRTGRHSLRRRMHLDGLVPCHSPLPPRPDDGPPPLPSLPPLPLLHGLHHSLDVVDGPPDFDLDNLKPFHERTDKEKEDLYERIAEQLAAIADQYNLESPHSPKPSNSPCSHSVPPEPDIDKLGAAAKPRGHHRIRTAELERQLGALLKEKGDVANRNLPDPTPVVAELVKNASYSKFKQIVNENIDSEPGWQQVAIMFRFTQMAVQMAGMGTAVGLQIKEMTLKYFEDKFASWIVGQGGWESMVEGDTNTEADSELD